MKKAIKSGLLHVIRRAGYDVVPRNTLATPGAENLDAVLPSKFIVTLPKSGSVFITRSLAQTLGLTIIKASPGYFPADNIDLTPMAQFHKGGCIAQSHIDPSPFNLSILSRFAAPWLVHLRDPRAALLSWTFHQDNPDIYTNPFVALCVYPPVPEVYYTHMSFEQKVDWQIANYYPELIRWIDNWCQIISSPVYADHIHVTTHEELVGREEIFIPQVIVRLWGKKVRNVELPPKDMSSHFRKGSIDEWRSALTPKQIEDTTALISPRAKEMFGWGL
jgi:hypothetical protein